MFSISDDIDVQRTPEQAFDFRADIRHENEWNAHVKSAELTSLEPIGTGTTFDVIRKGSGPSKIEITTFDRPNRLAYRSKFRGGEYTYDATFTPVEGGTHIAGVIEMRLLIKSRLAREMPEEDGNFKRAVESTEDDQPA